MKRVKQFFGVSLALLLLAVVFGFAPVNATSISEGYKTKDTGLVVGMTASLSPESATDNRIIERAASSNGDRFVGVVTKSNTNLLTLADESSTIYVATLGDVSVYGSDANGEIKKGDFVALSPLKGVVMRADAATDFVLGTALEDFPTQDAKAQEVSAQTGGTRTVLVNSFKIELAPRTVSKAAKDSAFLLIFGRSLTGKSVSQLQVISALVLFFFLIVIEGSIIYGAIYSSITALGRNPLARASVYKQMVQVSVASVLILGFGLAAIYAVLWS